MRTEKFYFGAALCDPAVAGKKNILIFCLAIPDEHWPLVVKEGENDLGCQVRYLLNYSDCVVSASRISVIFVFFPDNSSFKSLSLSRTITPCIFEELLQILTASTDCVNS